MNVSTMRNKKFFVPLSRLTGLCLFMFGLSCVAAAQVPVDQEPRHRVVFANEALRVLDVNVAARDTTLDHMHQNDIATVCISCPETRTRTQGADWGAPRTRLVGEPNVTEYSGKPDSHRLQNLGNSVYRLIAVENVRKGSWSERAPVSGAAAKMLNQTRAFRVYDVHVASSGSMPSHSHSSPTVVVLVAGETVARDERTPKVLDQPGQWILIPQGEAHRITTRGTGAVHAVEIEVR